MTALHSELEAAGPKGEQTGASGQLIPNQNKEIIFGVTALLLCAVGLRRQKSLFCQTTWLPIIAGLGSNFFRVAALHMKRPEAQKKGVGTDEHPEPPCHSQLDQSSAATQQSCLLPGPRSLPLPRMLLEMPPQLQCRS